MSSKLTDGQRDSLLLLTAAALCIQLKPQTFFRRKNVAEQLELVIEKAYQGLEADAGELCGDQATSNNHH
ncbi:MAG: hypothetical protein FWD31_15190 [Planctomycetaceae bacterium]|nr:hypothetical protein [Planctomycetaceae bacterium]